MLEYVRYKRMVNKDLLRQGEQAKRWQSAIIQQQQIHTSKKNNKPHYINTVVYRQTRYYIPEARFSLFTLHSWHKTFQKLFTWFSVSDIRCSQR